MKELKKAVTENKVIIGTDRMIKLMKQGKIKEVYLSSDCKEETKKRIKDYGKLSNTKITELSEPSNELGLICKKPFHISVAGF